MEKSKKYNDIYGGFGKTLNLGLTAGVSIALCTFLGYETDQFLKTAPKGIIGGAMFGVIAGAVYMWEQMKLIDRRLKKKQGNEKPEKELPQS